MPWNVQRAGSRYEVVQSQTGRVVGTHSTREQANAQLAALHANVHESSKSSGFSSEPYPDRNSAYDIASIAYSAPRGISNVDATNRLKEMINGKTNPKQEEKAEQPVKNTWMGQFFPRRM
jgi:hypothetical protein